MVVLLFGLVAEIFFGFAMLAFFAARFGGEVPFDESSAMARYQCRRSSPSGLPSLSQIYYSANLTVSSPISVVLCFKVPVRMLFPAMRFLSVKTKYKCKDNLAHAEFAINGNSAVR